MAISKGDAILIPTGNGKSHLFFVLNDPLPDPPKQVLLISISTYHGRTQEDSTCLLNDGDHEFIKHESYVEYSIGRIATLESVERNIATNYFSKKEPLSEDILQKIIDGIYESKRVKPFIKEFLESCPKP